MSVRCCQDFFNDLSTSITGAAQPPSIPSTDALVVDLKTVDGKKREKGKKYFISGYNIFNYEIKDGLKEEVD